VGIDGPALVLGAALAVGCSAGGAQGAPDASTDVSSKDGAGDAGTPFTLDAMRAASIAYNTKFCNAMAKCDPEILTLNYGDVATCIDADAGPADLAVWFPYGSTLTPDKLTACAAALDLSTCEKYALFAYENQIPTACTAISYGTLPTGAACANNGIGTAPLWNQCDSGRCFSTGGPCGTCADALPAGATCNGFIYCASGLGCPQGKCVPYGDVGDPCSGLGECHTYLACIGGKCVTPPADDSCDPQYGCAVVPQFRNCDPTTRKCVSSIVGPGQPCGYPNGNNEFATLCAYPYVCTEVTAAGAEGGGADAGSFVCAPPPGLGEPCFSFGLDTGCPRGGLRQASCIDNTCTFVSAAECSSPAVPP